MTTNDCDWHRQHQRQDIQKQKVRSMLSAVGGSAAAGGSREAAAGAVAAAVVAQVTKDGELRSDTATLTSNWMMMGSEAVASQTTDLLATTCSAWLANMAVNSANEEKSNIDMADQTAAVQAAQQIIADMLAAGGSSLPSRVASGLRSVSSLLRVAETHQVQPKTKRLRCSLPQDYVRHLSSWSTTTSATGLPTVEPPMSQHRQVSIRHGGGRHSLSSSSSHSIALSNGSPYSSYHRSMPKSRSFSDAQPDSILNAMLASRRFTTIGPTSLMNSAVVEHSQEGFDDNASDVSSSDGLINTFRDNNLMDVWNKRSAQDVHEISEQEAQEKSNQNVHDDNNDLSNDSLSPQPAAAQLHELYNATDIEANSLLSSDLVNQWDYPIFSLADKYPSTVLSLMAFKLFSEIDLIETFRIPIPEFLSFFHALEMGYHDNPYHNRTHAADVLHGVYYMTTQPVPGFCQLSPDSELLLGKQNSPGPDGEHGERHIFTAADSYGIIGGNLPALELMALFTAAAMHDYDHPGRTNAFLVTTLAPLAVLYNDRSVLESHHAASAWRLYLSDPRFNWLANLDQAEFKRLRYLVIELILATDLKRHFELVAEFNTKVNDVDAVGIDWMSERDRLMVSNMIIKMADICGPTKPKGLHENWTHRISEEFYDQGDDETHLGLPISPFMDRTKPQLARLQESFISHLVEPLCSALSTAELLPGCWADEERKSNQNGDAEADQKKIICPLVDNLKANYDMWKAIIKLESEPAN